MKAIIVGGGIGGLATAVALDREGWEVEVLEQARAFGEVGAGLSVWPNGLRALDALGVGDAVRDRALTGTRTGIRNATGRWLSHTDTDELERRYGQVAMVHRADLLEVLRSSVPAHGLRSGIRVTDVRDDGTVVHTEGESRGDLVVGADGIRSAVRQAIWPQAPAPVYSGYAAWRLVTRPVPLEVGSESWGRGERVGLAPLPDGRVYLFAVVNAAEGSEDGGLAEVRRRFGRWHDPIPALLEAAGDATVHYDGIYELPPLDTYVTDRVVLIGDAAHAMTPNLGQGACQALEDAVELAATLARGDSLDDYDRRRRPRTQAVARRAARIGRLAQASSPVSIALRNTVMRLTPRSSFIRSLRPVLGWDPDLNGR